MPRDEFGKGTMNRDQMAEVIEGGRVVVHKGKVYTRAEDLPRDEEITEDPGELSETLALIRRQQEELADRQRHIVDRLAAKATENRPGPPPAAEPSPVPNPTDARGAMNPPHGAEVTPPPPPPKADDKDARRAQVLGSSEPPPPPPSGKK
jgi:hypothetical protein